jgi:FkbM family methyltransferase
MFITHQKVHGRYLEVGGANGVTHSNTISLRDNNSWSGILVEPHPLQFSDLKRFRGHSDSLHSVALTPQSAESHQLLIDMGQLSALQDLAPNDEHAATRSKAGRLHRVRTEPLDAFLRQAGKIDYFSLDVEGAELELVKCMVQKTEFRPPVMTIEHNFRDDRDIVKELMESAGYVECFSSMPWLTRGDAWFVLQDVLKTFH